MRTLGVLRSITPMALLGLVGCSLEPHYRRPDTPVPAAWRMDEGRGRRDQPDNPLTDVWPSPDWTRGFNSPQLDELIARARGQNDDIGAAMARVFEADAMARVAGAALLPSVSAGGNAVRERQVPVNAVPQTNNMYTATLSAGYQIDFWGKYRATRDAAVFAAAASRYDRATVEIAVMTGVATTYFQTLELRDRLRVSYENLARAQGILDGLSRQQGVGMATALDVAQQDATVATLQAAIPPLKQQLLQAIDALAILVGQSPTTLTLDGGTLADLTEPQVAPGLPSELLRRRPDIASAEAQLMAANANVGAARAAFFPTIALTADGGYSSTALSRLLSPGSRIFSLGAGLTQPIFQGGALSGQYQYGKARYLELQYQYRKTVITAFSNVEDALVALRHTAEQEQLQQQSVDAARTAYELSQAQLHAGVIDILTVLNTQSALFTAEDALVQVRLSHFLAVISLFSALGGGWQFM